MIPRQEGVKSWTSETLRSIEIEKVVKAVELDAGQALPGLRESLAQAKRGEFAVVHTPEMIAGYRAKAARRAASRKMAK